jgi:cytidylate kinase
MIITIDGPSGSGKTTLAVNLAKHLHFFCMSSGYLYRGVAYILKNFYSYDDIRIKNPNIDDVQAILNNNNFRYEYEYGIIKIYWVDNITQFLKDVEISKASAMLAQNDATRAAIKWYEKKLVSSRDSIVEGRACGSSMYPQAEIKFYIDAPVEIRAHRLQNDQMKRGKEIHYAHAFEQIEKRDFTDKNRLIDPLLIPQDAVVLDSSKYTSEELLKYALSEVGKYFKR